MFYREVKIITTDMEVSGTLYICSFKRETGSCILEGPRGRIFKKSFIFKDRKDENFEVS